MKLGKQKIPFCDVQRNLRSSIIYRPVNECVNLLFCVLNCINNPSPFFLFADSNLNERHGEDKSHHEAIYSCFPVTNSPLFLTHEACEEFKASSISTWGHPYIPTYLWACLEQSFMDKALFLNLQQHFALHCYRSIYNYREKIEDGEKH